ncbi:bifunctional DNA primase/polymerase [Streptomyces sp. BPTC-684]|uniref:bifunctional DNA primase/polymerase n=1 Tax=Streptomyces sp. BPTC-684 TaxID=3043734 RepID=UPI0024B1D76B|nr:bifunctional DNA primase/polymerase [Streptomyces sp. BPTC-684]WHM37664.1 bifunctional DNA primase/polymerase [Streptomyces sp. BPTC-684]
MATIDRHASTLALAHALSVAERGLPVIPLSRSKLPALRSPHHDEPQPALCRGECGLPGHGVHDATTDPAAVRALFAAAPWATGYGIACGRPPHHLIGIDLDTMKPVSPTGTAAGASVPPQREPGALRPSPPSPFMPLAADPPPESVAALQHLALRHLFTIPETVVVITPSGGRHIWLTGPPDRVVPNSASRLAPGIDVRGAGGYLVGPGSLTGNGVYRLAPGTAHLAPAPCPDALLDLLTPPARAQHSRAYGTDRGHGLVQFVLAAHEGQRNTRLFWAACRAYENGIGDALADRLTAAAIRTGLTEREARATIASAARLTTAY